PPARDFGVEIVQVALKPARQVVAPFTEPNRPGMQIVFKDRPVGPVHHLIRRGLSRAPEVADEPVGVVSRLRAIPRLWPTHEHRQRAHERLNIISHIAESPPDFGRDCTLAAEPGNWRLVGLTVDYCNSGLIKIRPIAMWIAI